MRPDSLLLGLYRLLGRPPVPPWLLWRVSWAISSHFLLSVVGVIRDDQGRVLLFHHRYRPRKPWGLPTGWMAQGESPLESLEREVREESGLGIGDLHLLMVGTTAERPRLEFVVGACLTAGDFHPSAEVDAMQWCRLDALPPLPHSQVDILRRVAAQRTGELTWYPAPWDVLDPLERLPRVSSGQPRADQD